MSFTVNKNTDIIILRGLGYHQDEIAEYVGVSVKTVQNHLNDINKLAKKTENKHDMYMLFWNCVLGINGISLIRFLLKNK